MDPLARYESLVDDAAAFHAACDRPLPKVVRVNSIKASVERVRDALRADGIGHEAAQWHPGVLRLSTDSPGTTWPYFHGWIHGQEEVSSLPAQVLAPAPGERVWDACAAPGNKTTQLSALMDDTGLVVANDTSIGRLSALRHNAERLGATNVAVTARDARQFSLAPFDGREAGTTGGTNGSARTDGSGGQDKPERRDGADGDGTNRQATRRDATDVGATVDAFDRALVDAPCSCEGTCRKNPDVRSTWTLDHVRNIARVQRAILERAVELTRPGGVVVYATCTFAPEENEAVLDHALRETDCRVVGFDCPLEAAPGVTEWDGESYHPSVERARRIYPHQNDTGGFFCAKLAVGGGAGA